MQKTAGTLQKHQDLDREKNTEKGFQPRLAMAILRMEELEIAETYDTIDDRKRNIMSPVCEYDTGSTRSHKSNFIIDTGAAHHMCADCRVTGAIHRVAEYRLIW